MADDALDRLTAQLFAVAPELGSRRIQEIAATIRRDMGGAAHYIRKEPAAGKGFVASQRLREGASLREAVEAAGFRWGTGSARRFITRWGFS